MDNNSVRSVIISIANQLAGRSKPDLAKEVLFIVGKASNSRLNVKAAKSPIDQFEDRILTVIKKQGKKLAELLTDEIVDNLTDNTSGDETEIAEALTEVLSGNWEVYSNRPDLTIVKNVKSKGFPDWDEVFKLAAKKLNVPEDAIRDYGGGDSFWYELHADHVNMETENFETGSYDYTVVGRSGGYHGLVYEDTMVDIDADKIEKVVVSGLKKYKYTSKDFDGYDEENFDEDDIFETLFDALLEKFQEHFDDQDWDELIKPSTEANKIFNSLDKTIDATIKWFETPEPWVDSIVANEYHEDPEDYEDVNEED